MNINTITLCNNVLRDEFSNCMKKELGTKNYTSLAQIIGQLDVLIQTLNKENKKDERNK